MALLVEPFEPEQEPAPARRTVEDTPTLVTDCYSVATFRVCVYKNVFAHFIASSSQPLLGEEVTGVATAPNSFNYPLRYPRLRERYARAIPVIPLTEIAEEIII